MTQAIDELLGEVSNAVSASKEQTIASQALAQDVAGKMGEIDDRINNAVNEITEAIITNNLVKYYIDAIDGDDSNSGSSASPLQTIKRGLTICPPGSTANIYLKRSQRHLISSNIQCYALSLSVIPWGGNTDTSGSAHYDTSTPIVEWNATIKASGGVVFGAFKSSLIIDVGQNGALEYYSTAGRFTLARSKILIDRPSSTPFIGSDFDYLNAVKVSLRDATIEKISGYLSRRGCILSADSVIGASTIEELVLGATRDNTLTNMNFAY